jgi:predicted ATPase
MVTAVDVAYFKRFERQRFDLSDHIVLAGPNNSGKTTLLQAITVWDLALRRWKERRGLETRSTARERTGVPLTRKDFTALPLREMNLLWTDTLTALRKEDAAAERKPGQPRVLSIALSGRAREGAWQLTLEFRYQNTELLYVKPSADQIGNIPQAAEDVRVVHVPPFSGIGAEETRYDRPYQDLLIGQGKPGDILRNLLLEVYQQDGGTSWDALCREVEEIFGYRLLPPEYEGRPFILCEYLRGIPKGSGKDGLPQLDIASAGSGFHQVLLLLSLFHARPASVLLLDEPDAHLHVILQKQVYDRLRRIAAERSCQLIIATHSEVLIDDTDPERILSFFCQPHRLVGRGEREQITQALRRLTAMDVLRAEASPGVLYVEGESDFNLLAAWARVLQHPLHQWFANQPFWHANQGRHPQEARGHFFALRAIRPQARGVLLLDGDNRNLPEHEVRAEGLEVLRWERYEADSYLIHPVALLRFIGSRTLPLFVSAAEQYLRDELPPAVYRDPLAITDYLRATPASKTLLPKLFEAAQVDMTKKELYLIAEQMRPDEVTPEVREKLDAVHRALGLTCC